MKLLPCIYAGRPHSFLFLGLFHFIYLARRVSLLQSRPWVILFCGTFGAMFGNASNGYLDWEADQTSERAKKHPELYYWDQIARQKSDFLYSSIVSGALYAAGTVFLSPLEMYFAWLHVLLVFIYNALVKNTRFKQLTVGFYISSPMFILHAIHTQQFRSDELLKWLLWLIFQTKTEYCYDTFDTPQLNVGAIDIAGVICASAITCTKFGWISILPNAIWARHLYKRTHHIFSPTERNKILKWDLLIAILLSIT
jgi:hypothetical protein